MCLSKLVRHSVIFFYQPVYILLCCSLGSTRFFKVARARSQEGLIVVKVFAIHDPTLPLATYRDRVEEIRIKLASAVNCLPFQRAIVSCFVMHITLPCSLNQTLVHYTNLDSLCTKYLLNKLCFYTLGTLKK